MGSTVSPLVSFRITMGMLVTGSIMSPRIFISTSIVAPEEHRFQIEDFRLQISNSREISHLQSKIFNSEIALLRSLYHHFAQQAVGKTRGGNHRDIAAHFGTAPWRRCEIQRLVLRSAADPLAAGFVLPFNHYFKNLAHVSLVAPSLDLALPLLQD